MWNKVPLFCLIFLIAMFVIHGCVDNPEDDSAKSKSEMFSSFYENFDRYYSYFVYKEMDWPAQRQKYEEELLGVNTDEEFIDVLLNMVEPLRDVHIYFRSDHTAIPSYKPDHFRNWDKTVWESYMKLLDWQQQSPDWGYARIGTRGYISIRSWKAESVNIVEFDAAMEELMDCDTLIIDVRMNGGGNDLLALDIAGRFTTETRIASYYKFRDGPLHTDFTELRKRFIYPRGSWQFTKPVFVLTGRACFSSNETFISGMGEIPHVKLVGDTTGGSSGFPEIFDLGNGWEYSVPTWINYTPDLKEIEWNGIPPDIYIETTAEDFHNMTDPVLDYFFP